MSSFANISGLVSTREGLPFYTAMGFRQVSIVEKYVRSNGMNMTAPKVDGFSVSHLTKEDLAKICDMDHEAMGVARHHMLQGKFSHAIKALKAEAADGIEGFTIAVMEGELLCIGPVIAPDENTAAALILSASSNHSGPIRLDIWPENKQLTKALIKNGFTLERVPPVLCYGENPLPAQQSNYRAIAAQALG